MAVGNHFCQLGTGVHRVYGLMEPQVVLLMLLSLTKSETVKRPIRPAGQDQLR
jgi:hypothetical protein